MEVSYLRQEILELFEEAQRVAPHELPAYMFVRDRPNPRGCFMCGRRRHRPRRCAERLVLGEEGARRLLRSEKNARYAANNPRRAYRTTWQSKAALKERVERLREGYAPKRWGKLWQQAREIVEGGGT